MTRFCRERRGANKGRRLGLIYQALPFVSLLSLATLFIGCAADSPAPTLEKAAEVRLTLGLAYLEQGKLKLASGNLHRAMEYQPNNYRTHLALALYEQRIGEYDKARQRYLAALKLSPEQNETLNYYGLFLCQLGEYAGAYMQFELALNQTNYDTIADSLENAGYCHLKQGQYRQAKEFLDRALKYEPIKSKGLLVTAERYLAARDNARVAILLELYQQSSPITAESVWLQIRFAALNENLDGIEYYGQMLAKNFSQSEQYKQFLTNEY